MSFKWVGEGRNQGEPEGSHVVKYGKKHAHI